MPHGDLKEFLKRLEWAQRDCNRVQDFMIRFKEAEEADIKLYNLHEVTATLLDIARNLRTGFIPFNGR